MTDVFEVPRFLEQDWKDWWTINDYIAQGKSYNYNPTSTIPNKEYSTAGKTSCLV